MEPEIEKSKTKVSLNNEENVNGNEMSSESRIVLNETAAATTTESTSPNSHHTPPSTSSSPLVSSNNRKNDSTENNSDIPFHRSTSKTVCFHSVTGQPGSNRKINNGQFLYIFTLILFLYFHKFLSLQKAFSLL